MAKFDKETINRWASLAADYLNVYGYNTSEVITGREAWSIAHQTGITNEAYTDRDVVDAHIVTALKAIFPNAVFKDRYSY